MLPAHQHFSPHAAAACIGLGLQIHAQLPLGDAVVQVFGDAHAAVHILRHAGLKQHQTARPFLLGLVQSHTGKTQRVIAIATTAGGLQHHPAHTAADQLGFHPAIETEGLLQGLLQGVRILPQLLFHPLCMRVQASKNNSKLSSRNPRYPGIVGQNLHQSGSHRLHQFIAVLHAMHIVEHREAVHIQQQQTMAVALLGMNELAQVQGERMAVWQAGERIQIDQIVNMALCQHALGQVALEFHVVDDLALWRANGHDQ